MRRRVKFNEKVRVRLVKHLNDFSTKQIQACWFTPKEAAEIRQEAQRQVSLLDSGMPSSNPSDSSSRGLRSSAQEFHRQASKRQALMTVLKEQEAQRQVKRTNPGRLAELYQDVSTESRASARIMGKRDELEAQEYAL